MAKFYGVVGFADIEKSAPGVTREVLTEKTYKGDVYRNMGKVQYGENLNNEINVSQEIHILLDPYSHKNFHKIRYVSYMGSNWRVTNVEVRYPRLVMQIGGVYSGPTAARTASQA